MGDGVQPQPVKPPRIYADFNGICSSPRNPEKDVVVLDTRGTLCGLADAGIVLEEGLRLTIWSDSDENEDLEADVVVYYHDKKNSWVGEVIDDFRHVPALNEKSLPLVCVACRFNFEELIVRHGLNGSTDCPECGVPAWRPILPPAR